MKKVLFPTTAGRLEIPSVTYRIQVRRPSRDPFESFFFTPTDAESNMERVYVFRAAIREVRQGPDAVKASEEHQADPPAGRQESGIGNVYRID